MAILYTAKEVNAGIRAELEPEIAALQAEGICPTLATVRVGEKGADISYELGATKRMKDLGLGVRNEVLPADVSQEELIAKLEELSSDPTVHGILLFQPLPAYMNDEAVKASIAPVKDIDCATVDNLGAVLAGWEDCYPYCAPAAVMEMLNHYHIKLEGANVVVVGSGLVVGRPLSMMLANRLATVSVCNVYTKDTRDYTRRADIVISAAGVAGLIDDTYVSPGQIVLDVGTTFKDGKLYGDVNLEKVEPIVKAVTPTPGGISGITNMVLAKHVVQAARRLKECGLSSVQKVKA